MKATAQLQKTTTSAAPKPRAAVAFQDTETERPEVAAQLEGAALLGHSLAAMCVDSPLPVVQRQELPEQDKEEQLQMKPEGAALQRQGRGEGFRLDDETAGRIHRARGGGQPLDEAVRVQMGETLGHDFSSVRVHTDSEADALNQQLNARAFTIGQDIFFRQGEHKPDSGCGQELLTHELAHVVQQGIGRVHGGGRGVTVRPDGDRLEQEAEAAVLFQRTQHGVTDPNRHHISARQMAGETTSHGFMPRQLGHIGRSNESTAQRNCWQMDGALTNSFLPGTAVHADMKAQVYWRMQWGDEVYHGPYFAPVVDGEPDVWGMVAHHTVTENDRDLLAVTRAWVPLWNFLVLYEVTPPNGLLPYWGFTASQTDEDGWVFQGGAVQAVFPPGGDRELIEAVPVEEVAGGGPQQALWEDAVMHGAHA